jgi:DNA-binding GntR family transcriptional regulator
MRRISPSSTQGIPDVTPRRPCSAKKKTAASPRYEELRNILEQAIIKGELPPGTRLEEQELARRYGVSRTPVRETLRLLASTGLVDMRLRQGAIVATLTIPRLIQMFQVMAELEGLCARLAARRVPQHLLEKMEESHGACAAALSSNDPETFYDANRIFHEAIYTASNNQFLEETTRALRNRVAPYRRYVTYQPGRMIESVREHEAVLAAIRAGDGETADRLMRDHVNLLGDSFADFVSSIPAEPEPAGRKQFA